jgi:hypothetical protein
MMGRYLYKYRKKNYRIPITERTTRKQKTRKQKTKKQKTRKQKTRKQNIITAILRNKDNNHQTPEHNTAATHTNQDTKNTNRESRRHAGKPTINIKQAVRVMCRS